MTNPQTNKKAIKIKENFYYVGAADPKRKIFDIIMHLDHGTTYNSYLIKGKKKNCLIELVRDTKDSFGQLMSRLNSVLTEKETIDYLVFHHTEPDHVLVKYFKLFIQRFPNITILASSVGIENLKRIINHDVKFLEVNSNFVLRLGGYSLRFQISPFLHWPDTIFSYCTELKTLFCCDAFGSHLGDTEIFTDLITDENKMKDLRQSQIDYFNFIMRPFKSYVQKFLKKIANLDKEIICCSHGPIIRGDHIQTSIKCYTELSKITARENKVLIVYGTSHGFTEEMVKEIKIGIESVNEGAVKTVIMDIFNPKNTVSRILQELESCKGLLLGSPTILGDVVPHVSQIAIHLNPWLHGNKIVGGAFGSFGWSGEATENLTFRMIQCRMKVVRPLRVQFRSTKEDITRCRKWGSKFSKIILGVKQIDEEFEFKIRKLKLKLSKYLRSDEMEISKVSNKRLSKFNKSQYDNKNSFKEDGKLKLWKCLICGEIIKSVLPPDYYCPACGAGPEVFVCIGFANPEYNKKSKEKLEEEGLGLKINNNISSNDDDDNDDNDKMIQKNIVLTSSHESFNGVMDDDDEPNVYTGHIVIVGASGAGVSAVKAIRSNNSQAKITLISGENAMPYYRPTLTSVLSNYSKSEEKEFFLLNKEYLVKNEITFYKNSVVTEIKRKKKMVKILRRTKKLKNTSNQEQYLIKGNSLKLNYDRLILAVGSNQKIPKEKASRIKTIFGKKKKKKVDQILNEGISSKLNVFGLRTLDDVTEINSYIKINSSKSAIILGCGPLGIETAESLSKLGVEKIYMIETHQIIASHRLDEMGSSIVEKILVKNKMKLFLGYEMIKILDKGDLLNANNGEGESNSQVPIIEEGEQSKIFSNKKKSDLTPGLAIQSIHLTEEEIYYIYADLIIFASGVYSEITLAKKCKLSCGRGILVNEQMRSISDENIFACGDCIEYKGYLDKSWRHSVVTGEIAGLASIGVFKKKDKYVRSVPPYSIFAFGYNIFCVGNIHDKKLESINVKSSNGQEYLRLFFEIENGIDLKLVGSIYVGKSASTIVDLQKYIAARASYKSAVKRLVNHNQISRIKKENFSSTRSSDNFKKLKNDPLTIIPNLHSLINLKDGLELFRKFLVQEFSEENLDFWLEIDNYKKMKNGHPNQIDVAKHIYDDFISYGSPQEININHKNRVKITDLIRDKKIYNDMFDDAQKEIDSLLVRDSFPRFIKSDFAYSLIIMKKLLDREISEVQLSEY
ncbi:diflavin flavoprotein a 2-related [Anaeramoeba flamelloides]|uniref:Diflavin flavoprotein a 2-related n=1 Tax=Anaeramoeba flamelloides TaxID=1746091 RepID=A0ABQ8Z1A8_9EUKA|nr:diflavin flavoprotein a 2-related [Anaeramoeba flamelloides]